MTTRDAESFVTTSSGCTVYRRATRPIRLSSFDEQDAMSLNCPADYLKFVRSTTSEFGRLSSCSLVLSRSGPGINDRQSQCRCRSARTMAADFRCLYSRLQARRRFRSPSAEASWPRHLYLGSFGDLRLADFNDRIRDRRAEYATDCSYHRLEGAASEVSSIVAAE